MGKGEFKRTRAWSRALIPFPFPFERLPRRLPSSQQDQKKQSILIAEISSRKTQKIANLQK